MSGVQAVMFDWRGTLVVDWPDDWWVRRALRSLARPNDAVNVDRICQALAGAREIVPISEMKRTEDCSAEQHREANLAWFDAAGLDVRLGEALYNLDFDARCHPFAEDVPEVLRALKARDLKIVIVSNIHIDLRQDFRAAGLHDMIDAYVLSFEHGVCKPESAIFDLALHAVGASRSEALMVGDRAEWDGGAARIGIPTLLVPTLREPQSTRLHLVVGLVDAPLAD